MRKNFVFKINHNSCSIEKYCFRKDEKPININEIDTKKIVLSNKTSYGKEGANTYYIGYVGSILDIYGSTGFKPLHIIIKDIKLHTNYMNVLANNNELLKYIE